MTLSLTDEQRAVAEAPPDSHQLVLASPGTGKTHTLIARMIHLVENMGLKPGGELLVLSFSRAAVAELRDRLAKAGGNAAYVRAVTFDSFATRLLSDTQPGGPWEHEGYLGRIKRATRWITVDEGAQDYLARFKHVLVDEIQDVVGERVRLTQSILHAVDGGFTLFGDPAQGIFSFVVDGPKETPWTLVKWLRDRMRDELQERILTENKRTDAESPAATAMWAAPALLGQDREFLSEGEIDYDKIFDRLVDTVLSLLSLGGIGSAYPRLTTDHRRTAILTRRNVDALLISRELWRLGVPHSLQREATDRALPRWIGVALRGITSDHLSRSALRDAQCPDVGSEEAWDLLKRIERSGGRHLDVHRLWQNVKVGVVPDDLSAPGRSGGLVVSTIHRAKGREFDCVALAVEPEEMYKAASIAEDLPEECRVVFVGLTRSRKELFHVSPPPTSGYFLQRDLGRWMRRSGGNVTEMEVQGRDSACSEPPGWPSLSSDVLAIQEYLSTEVSPGDEVELRLQSVGDRPSAYFIYHNGYPIGAIGEEFNRCLLRTWEVYGKGGPGLPEAVTDLFVDVVDTVAGNRVVGRRAGLGASGLWLRPRVHGLGNCTEGGQNVV